MMGSTSEALAVGAVAPDFALPGVDGRTWALGDFAEAAALVVVFTCNHCPYAQAAEGRLDAIARDYAGAGARLVAINPNDAARYPEDSFDAMKARAEARGFAFPYLYDESQEVARAYRAVCTPDPFVFDAARRLVYNGRIDDDWQRPERATQHDLRRAVELALAGRAFDGPVTPSRGCSIKWRH